MLEELIIKGNWFLPNKKSNKIAGILKFDPYGGANLEIYGLLINEMEDNHRVILGLTIDRKKIVLYNNILVGRQTTSYDSHDGYIDSESYDVEYIFEGIHLNEDEELVFDEIVCELFSLREWISKNGFTINKGRIGNSDKIEIEYKKPENIEFKVSDTINGTIEFFTPALVTEMFISKINLEQKVHLKLKSESEIIFYELLKLIRHFQNFLSMGLYKYSYPISIILKGPRHQKTYSDSHKIKINVRLYYSMYDNIKKEKPIKKFRMFFCYENIDSDFNSIISKWYSIYPKLQNSFDLLFFQFKNSQTFTINTFLNFAQAAEIFHAKTNNHTKVPKSEYLLMKKEILENTPKKYHSWLNDQFSFGNNLPLIKRLEEIVRIYSCAALDEIIGNKDKFVLDIKNSRNYYTHYSQKKGSPPFKDIDLFYLSEKLKLLLICSFLIEIGVNRNDVEKFIVKSKNKLFSHLNS